MNEILQKRNEKAARDFNQKEGTPFALIGHVFNAFVDGANYALSNQWISVEEALPEYEEDVFVRFIEHFQNNTDEFEVGYCTRWRTSDKSVKTDSKEFSIIGNMEITHWMPIPELPKGGEE